MKNSGQECSRHIFNDCREILGKKPESVDELLNAMNQRRLQKNGLSNVWKKQDKGARLKIDECNCTLVKAGLAKANPIHCLCSVGMMESLFSAICRGPVRVELIKAAGLGDEVCEFYVNFVE